jgi:hypothetical protein
VLQDSVMEPASATLDRLRREAAALEPLAITEPVRRFLRATAALPSIEPRTILHDAARTRAVTADQAASLTPEERSGLQRRVLDESYYYTTRYGSPLAYARPLDLVVQAAGTARGDVPPAPPPETFAGLRILDFGYGSIGHLRLLASLGATVVGIEIDPLLHALYSHPGDQGTITGFEGGPAGILRLVHGRWPADETARQAVNEGAARDAPSGDHGGPTGGYDLVLSKNVLKNGYLHPAEPVDARMMVNLGVEDEAFVRALAEAIRPGGLLMIYNLCPAPAAPGKPYIPWADGRCPFPRGMLESAGFEVLAFDQSDDTAARALGRALGWDEGAGAMNLETDLFALYTLARRR